MGSFCPCGHLKMSLANFTSEKSQLAITTTQTVCPAQGREYLSLTYENMPFLVRDRQTRDIHKVMSNGIHDVFDGAINYHLQKTSNSYLPFQLVVPYSDGVRVSRVEQPKSITLMLLKLVKLR